VAARVDDDRLVDGQLDGIEDDLVDGLGDRDRDRFLTTERQRGEVGLQPYVVTARDDGAR
jgi:hypothetical protein